MLQTTVKESSMVSPYFLFFLVHGAQTGIGVLKFQTSVIKGAEQDAWVSLLVVGISMHILFFMMLHIIKQSSRGDIISFHTDTFGKIVGGLLNIILSLYLCSVGLFVFYSYIDILQIWVFQEIGTWEFAILGCFIIYYVISGGFRVITGVAFWGVVIPSFLLLTIAYLFSFSDFTYIMPLFNHGIKDYFISAKESGFNFLGLECVLIYFPFIKNGIKDKRWGHFGLLYTTVLYLVIAILTFTFFTQGNLQLLSWPTLNMIKVIQLPFLERFEFIFIFTWMLVTVPVISIYLWSSVRIVKETFRKMKPTIILIAILIVYFLFFNVANDMFKLEFLDKTVSLFGVLFLYGYIPFLFMISLVKSMMGKRKQKPQESQSTETAASD